MGVEHWLSRCRWPQLPERYDAALREAVRYILSTYEPLGVVAAGTIVRGVPDAASDLDLYVIHDKPWRQRVQKYFGDVPAEIFVNPPASVRRFFRDEHADGRPSTAHMLATGRLVLCRDDIVETLRQEAAEWLSKRVEYAPSRATVNRYYAATLYEDARDVATRDPAAAGMLLHQAVVMMLRHWFLRNGVFIPRDKDVVKSVMTMDEPLGRAAAAFFTAPLAKRWPLARFIAERTIEADGFFEWESEPAPVADADVEAGGVVPGNVETADMESADVARADSKSAKLNVANGEGWR